MPASEVLAGIDGLVFTHLHIDHYDATARELVDRELPVLHQPEDGEPLRGDGFSQLTVGPLGEPVRWLGLEVVRVAGEHGVDGMERLAGPVSGFVLRADGEPCTYLAGDTVWCDAVAQALAQHRPDLVVVNAGGAEVADGRRLIMNADDVARVVEAAPQASVVAVHLDAITHCVVGRAELRRRFGTGVAIPEDGERLRYGS
jgi:L-ascorbate metabolism protein UlaG (beta-lactamase superfamily)